MQQWCETAARTIFFIFNYLYCNYVAYASSKRVIGGKPEVSNLILQWFLNILNEMKPTTYDRSVILRSSSFMYVP